MLSTVAKSCQHFLIPFVTTVNLLASVYIQTGDFSSHVQHHLKLLSQNFNESTC